MKRLLFAALFVSACALAQITPENTGSTNPQTFPVRYDANNTFLNTHIVGEPVTDVLGTSDYIHLWINDGGGWRPTLFSTCANGVTYDATAHTLGCRSATVSSVGLSLPGIFTVTNSPVTSAATLTATLATQSANRIWAGPTTGSAAAPTFRALVAGDIPAIAESGVTNLVPDLGLKAPLASPSLSGTPTAPTASAGTNTNQIATTAFVLANGVSTKRILSGAPRAAKCAGGIPGAAYSLKSPNPTAQCESDLIQAYLAFDAATLENVYDAFDIPADWTGALTLVVSGYNATNANAPTVNAYLSCIGSAATASPTFGSATGVTVTIASANTRASSTTDLTSAASTAGCAAGQTLYWKLAITAGASTEFRLLAARLTE